MKIVLIHNSLSGQNMTLPQLKKMFRRHKVTVTDSFSARQLNSAKLAALVQRGVTVAVVGGDGTHSNVAELIAGTKSTLLPLPGGTFNHFVRDLGMESDIEAVLGHLDDARKRMIDVAYVNGRLFLNNSNIGMYPFSLLEQKKTRRIVGKWLAAAWTAVIQMVEFRRHRLNIDGRNIRTPFVFVGNNEYDLQAIGLPPKTTLVGGKLFVVVSTSSTRFGFMKAVFMAALGRARQHDELEIDQPSQLTIDSPHKKIAISYDGEAVTTIPPLHYHIEPKHLRVMYVPKSDV